MSNDNKATGHNLDTSEGARAYVAEFFANELRRHDFRAYITTRLAADFACALAKHLAARQPVELEPITVEAVAEIFNHPEYGLSINWLLENGIGELQVGDVLMVSDQAITDEDGSGEVYIAPPAPPADPYKRIPGLQGIGDAADYLARHPSNDYAKRHLCERIAEFREKHGVDQPAQAVDPADPWRGLYSPDLMPKLDGVNLYHIAHPDLPSWPTDEDEERGIGPLITAQGFAMAVELGEYPEDDGGDVDYCAWLASWAPDTPAGAEWRLVCIQDTEDGPAAFFVRPLALIDSQAVGNG